MLSADFEFELKHNARQALSTQCTEFLEHLRALSTKCVRLDTHLDAGLCIMCGPGPCRRLADSGARSCVGERGGDGRYARRPEPVGRRPVPQPEKKVKKAPIVFLIEGGLYSVTALRKNDNEGHSVY